MKNKMFTLVALVLLLPLCPRIGIAQGTAFTYQGRLNDGASPANGTYDLQFLLFNVNQFGFPIGPILTNTAVVVNDGLFTAALDFGSGVFTGTNYWLEISVRTNGGGAFATLTPRQPVTPSPYAIFAQNVGTGGLAAGNYPNAVTFGNSGNSFSGSFSGNGGSITNVNAMTLGGLASSNFWKLGGNAGSNPTNGNFIGTTDNLPFELRVSNRRALRVEADTNPTNPAVNVIGGAAYNYVSPGVFGATIGGGGGNYAAFILPSPATNSIAGHLGTIAGGAGNAIQPDAYSASIGGGFENVIGTNSNFGVIAGGLGNLIRRGVEWGSISGGADNLIDPDGAANAIGGGFGNRIATNNANSVIGGGAGNAILANSRYATVPGGANNVAASFAFAAGRRAKALHEGAFVWADSTAQDFFTSSSNQFLIRAGGGVGIGTIFPTAALHVLGAENDGSDAVVKIASGSQTLFLDGNEIDSNSELNLNNNSTNNVRLADGGGSVGIGRGPAANRLEVNGTASKSTAGDWLANSDARIKTDIKTVTGALEKLSAVRLVKFHYTSEYLAAHSGIQDREYLNVIAQEFVEVFPEHVKSSGEKLPDGSEILQVDTYPLTIYSAAAVQELDRKFTEELKRRDAENAELKSRLSALEKLITQTASK
jgi:hypothetical protein